MNPIKIDTFMDYNFVSNPSFSPDGKSIAFVAAQADRKSNGYNSDLYLYHCSSGKVKRLTASKDVRQYAFLTSGNLLFASARDGKKEDTTCYYEISGCGEAKKSFEVPLLADSLYVVDAEHYLITAAYLSETVTAERDEAYQIIDELPFWSNGKGFINGQRKRLYLYHVSSGELEPVSGEDAELGGFSVRGMQVLYKANPWKDVRERYDNLYLYDIATGIHLCLLENDRMLIGMLGFWSDGEAIVSATDSTDPMGNVAYPDFYTLDFNSGKIKMLTSYDYGSEGSTVGTDSRLGGGRIVKNGEGICYFITTRGYHSFLYAIRHNGEIDEVVTEPGSCDSFDIRDDQVVVCGLYGNKLPELYLNGKQITQMNDMSHYEISVPKAYTVLSGDGYSLTGWVLEPTGYEYGKKYPAILHIHGGPRTVFGTVFHHEMQVWANEGYFVLYTNPRGSDGFGTKFSNICGLYGTVDYDNLMDFTDYILTQQPDIDPERMGVTGGSYGGYMTNWIIGHTNRFAAAVSQRSIANWISFEHTSDIGHTFTKDTQSAFTCENPGKLWEHSPMKYIAGCETPTLFIHSDQDYRCHLAEGLEMFAALKILKVETRMCVLKGENHELSRSGKPANRIIRMKEILRWMNQYLKAEKTAGEEA